MSFFLVHCFEVLTAFELPVQKIKWKKRYNYKMCGQELRVAGILKSLKKNWGKHIWTNSQFTKLTWYLKRSCWSSIHTLPCPMLAMHPQGTRFISFPQEAAYSFLWTHRYSTPEQYVELLSTFSSAWIFATW